MAPRRFLISAVRIRWSGSLVLLGLAVSQCLAAELTPANATSTDMSRRVDELVAAQWKSAGVEPAAATTDAEFLRRVYLDLVGVVPTVGDAREFLDDQSPTKRSDLVERLLASPARATHMADVWRHLMLPGKFDPQQSAGIIGLQNWLRRQFADNRRYDRIVADLLVASGGDESGPALFFTSLGLKPEALGAATSRIFLGLRLDCAECHDHPFDHWTQQDFWGYAAFFAELQQRARTPANMRLVDSPGGEVRLPGTSTVVKPRYLEGEFVPAGEAGTRRQQLAIWIVSRDNPYLARAAVNLVWAQLFGRGLVEPLDDFGPHNPASHPEVLNELAAALVSQNYDLRWLYRTLANTRAYQLSSTGSVDAPPALFARMAVKTLSAEQIYDSLARVAMRPAATTQDRLGDPERQAFLVKMQTQTATATDYELNVPQALSLMNGPELNQGIGPEAKGLIAALEAPFLDDNGRVESMFLAALARLPGDRERSTFVEYVQAAPAEGRGKAFSDVVWALMNSSEFTLNR